jgi:two-component system chemotaxis response regulator CheY
MKREPKSSLPRALVVEDSRSTRAIIARFLSELGFEVFEAGDGREALRWIDESPAPDVVLVDWNMPGMDGCEFIRAARKRPALARTPMMMVTTEVELDRVTLALEAGADEYLMKPFDQQLLYDKLVILGLDPRRDAA